MPKATIYDVARLAAVSTATVSKVINNTGRISKDTSLRVETAMSELQYRPSILASALKKHQTFSLGLLVPDITNPFYGELARAVEDEALHKNYSVLGCRSDNRREREESQINFCRRNDLVGLIIVTSEGWNM